MSTIYLLGGNGYASRIRIILGIFGMACLSASLGLADAKVDQLPLGPDSDVLGCSVSPHGEHVAVLAAKGSRYVVLIDGVEGPKIEALLTAVYSGPFPVGTSWLGQIPVLFSNDGSHNAYIGKQGDEYVVMEDGKELVRGPIVPNGMANMTLQLTFSPGGQHLFFMNYDGGKYHVMVDGKPGPPTGIPQPLVISPDGAHYAYTGFTNSNLGNGLPNWAVVDGRQVNFIGNNLQYTGRNVLLSRMVADNNIPVLVINGKPSVKAAGIDPMWISPDGVQIAMVITPNSGMPTLFAVNGKQVPEAQGLSVVNVFFSPDGKRYAALCETKTNSSFMIIDGKKGEVYQSIARESKSTDAYQRWIWLNGAQPGPLDQTYPPVPGFTADSSKFVYVASQGGRQFLVVDEDESNGFSSQQVLAPILSAAGHRIAVIGIAPNGKQHVIIDGQDKEYGSPFVVGGVAGRCYAFNFTSDGTRYAFVDGPRLNFDGQILPGIGVEQQYAFSPDSKHVAYKASDGGGQLLFLDGKIVDSGPTVGQLGRIFFSPDSQHMVTIRRSNLASQGTKDSILLSVDGKPTVHYLEDNSLGGPYGGNFEFSSDHVLSFVGRTDGNLRLFHVTPSSDSNVGTMLASATVPKDKP